ncbi:hypothetical protein CPC08DRAFT_686789 [Agrocybe pediades]|nr:hypothetical protein CPC08DRAFT_686789 [Agrocybe pediades]
MIIYANPAFYVFLAALTAFILLLLTVFSIPLVSTLYFLHSDQANGVKFGMWGWCLDDYLVCSPLQLGYTWQPEIAIPITKALVLYPIAAVFSFLCVVSMVPILCVRASQPTDKIFKILSWTSFAWSFLSFLFMIGTFGTAKARFEKRGFGASYGNLPWMSLVASLLLLLVSLSPLFLGPSAKPKQTSSRQRPSTRQRADIEAQPSMRRHQSHRPSQQAQQHPHRPRPHREATSRGPR